MFQFVQNSSNNSHRGSYLTTRPYTSRPELNSTQPSRSALLSNGTTSRPLTDMDVLAATHKHVDDTISMFPPTHMAQYQAGDSLNNFPMADASDDESARHFDYLPATANAPIAPDPLYNNFQSLHEK